MNGAREDLLSYKLSIIKVLIGILCWVAYPILEMWMEQTGRPMGGAFGILRLIILMTGVISVIRGIVECTYTFKNRKFRKLKNMSITEIKSVGCKSTEFFRILKNRRRCIYIFKNNITVFRLGAETVYTGRGRGINVEIDHKYYYIDEIKNRRVERVKYRDFQKFKHIVNEMNGNRDTFDIVYAYKSEV